MNSRAAAIVGYRKDIVRVSIAGDLPGVLLRPFGPVQLDVLGIPVGICVDYNVVQSQIPATIHYADGYFATVGDEHLSFHTNPLAYINV